MNNSRWKMSKIGLLDFWYYDEEEYTFRDGRMLLRGSNGSGKSVTMQSFIPLILDGNMRPERLDPFGSRARKMENYLLEEGSEREERTGYLYLELKREETEVYLTIGIGMRARKNKKLDTWYFYIDDNRRIRQDFYLYKDLDAKIAYSKQELRNRIGEGGRVMESQAEYMEAVNRLVFGFETLDKYKEMLDLLIQLRSPKLSKDFKPTVLNEILSDSLLMLSEEDMRPMSEAIENMDALKNNLDALKESLQAASQIEKVYDRYNRIVLFQKAEYYGESIRHWKKAEQTGMECSRKIEELRQECSELEEKYEKLQQEQRILEQQRDSLNASDAVALKQKEKQLEESLQKNSEALAQKKDQVQKKQEQAIVLERKIKELTGRQEQLWSRVETLLVDMQESIEGIPFDEAAFLAQELKEVPEKNYDFEAHQRLLADYRKKIKNGVDVLQEQERQQERLDQELYQLDRYQHDRDAAEREKRSTQELLEEIRGELLEKCYQWAKKNEELKLSEQSLQEISRAVNHFDEQSDYGNIREMVRHSYQECETPILGELRELRFRMEQKAEECDRKKKEIRELEQQTGLRPEHSPEVERNRELLQKAGISFRCFYEAVDFESGLSPERAAHLEEALLQMGILDALIISSDDRERVLSLDQGVCDRYIFSDVAKVQNNMMEALDVDNPEQDILLQQLVSNILCGIGYQGTREVSTWVEENGHYRIGVLEGTVTGTYEAQYIGTATRERARQRKLAQLAEEYEVLRQEQEELLKCQTELEERKKKLAEELAGFPSGEDVRVAAAAYGKTVREVQRLDTVVAEAGERVTAAEEVLRQVRIRVQEICAAAYLTPRLDLFLHAEESLEEYRESLGGLRASHGEYCSCCEQRTTQQEMLDDVDATLDDLRYDMRKYEREQEGFAEELQLVREQSKLSGVEEISAKLDQCILRLHEIPTEREQTVAGKSTAARNLELKQRERQENEVQLLRLVAEKERAKRHFTEEYALGYVERTFVVTEDMEDQAQKVCKMLQGSFEGKKQADIFGEVQEVYHKERGLLLQYSLTMDYIFLEESGEGTEPGEPSARRIDLSGKYRGVEIKFKDLIQKLKEDMEEQERLLSDKDRELFEDILANTISKKIRARIHESNLWVERMNQLMGQMKTSSGLRLNLKWKSKRAEQEEELDTKELVTLLQKDAEIMREEEVEQLSRHFRSKIAFARKQSNGDSMLSFHGIMREVLDYRKWFQFQLEYEKTGEPKRELTDRAFFTFSGGEKAMAMYVPLFSAAVAKYSGAREDAPRIISLDEAFAGVDEMNIKDMFRLMVDFEFDFIINSQILWGDYESVPALAIYQLVRPENVKYVSVIPYEWNGRERILIT